jgi:hypothetical protein
MLQPLAPAAPSHNRGSVGREAQQVVGAHAQGPRQLNKAFNVNGLVPVFKAAEDLDRNSGLLRKLCLRESEGHTLPSDPLSQHLSHLHGILLSWEKKYMACSKIFQGTMKYLLVYYSSIL